MIRAPVPATPCWWQWPTVLSSDAPAVVLVWQLLLARLARIPLHWSHLVVLASSVWLAYAADRWVESWRVPVGQLRTERHLFYQRQRRPVAVVWILLLFTDVAIARSHLTTREWNAGMLLLVPVITYLLSQQWSRRRPAWWPPKEVCVATLLAAGVALFLVAPAPAVLRWLATPLSLFALLCFANCALISKWECEDDRTQGQTSLALESERGAIVSLALPWVVAGCATLLIVADSDGGMRTVAGCALASSLLLGAIDSAQLRIGRQRARVLADGALLTPVVPLVAGWLR